MLDLPLQELLFPFHLIDFALQNQFLGSDQLQLFTLSIWFLFNSDSLQLPEFPLKLLDSSLFFTFCLLRLDDLSLQLQGYLPVLLAVVLGIGEFLLHKGKFGLFHALF